MSIRVHGLCLCEYQGLGMVATVSISVTRMVVTVSIRLHGLCHGDYQGTGMGTTVSIRLQGWVSL